MKPAGTATIPGRVETTSVLEQIGEQIGLPWAGKEDPRIRVVHRLDKETSGVLLFAKDHAAQRHLSHQFQNNTIAKEYLAICRRPAGTRGGKSTPPCAPHPSSPERMIISSPRPPRRNRVEGRGILRRIHPPSALPQDRQNAPDPRPSQVRRPPPRRRPALQPPGPRNGRHPRPLPSHSSAATARPLGEEERPLISRLTLHAEKLKFTNVDRRRGRDHRPPAKRFPSHPQPTPPPRPTIIDAHGRPQFRAISARAPSPRFIGAALSGHRPRLSAHRRAMLPGTLF